MLKKLFIALVFSFTTFVWSGSSFADGHCQGSTMNDGQTGGKYPQQYELSEYESAAGCTMKFLTIRILLALTLQYKVIQEVYLQLRIDYLMSHLL